MKKTLIVGGLIVLSVLMLSMNSASQPNSAITQSPNPTIFTNQESKKDSVITPTESNAEDHTPPSPTATPKPTVKPTVIPTQTHTPKPTPIPTQATTGGAFSCNCAKTCANMSCAEAQYQLNTCKCVARDADHDGTACDSDCQ